MKMKKNVLLSSIMLLGVIVFAQNNLHDGKVVGIVDLGNQEVVIVNDENTGCSHKSSVHDKGFFQLEENVQIDFDNNGNNAKIIKPSLPEQVYLNKKCNGVDNSNNGVIRNAVIVHGTFVKYENGKPYYSIAEENDKVVEVIVQGSHELFIKDDVIGGPLEKPEVKCIPFEENGKKFVKYIVSNTSTKDTL